MTHLIFLLFACLSSAIFADAASCDPTNLQPSIDKALERVKKFEDRVQSWRARVEGATTCEELSRRRGRGGRGRGGRGKPPGLPPANPPAWPPVTPRTPAADPATEQVPIQPETEALTIQDE